MNEPVAIIAGTQFDIENTVWFKLPLKLRQRWWKETDYGKLAPSDDLKKAIDDALVRPDRAEVAQSTGEDTTSSEAGA